jgi:putative ABC transport system permease protein
MSGHHPRPARAIVWLLARVSSVHAAHAALGDMLEELDERASVGRPPRWPALWLNLHALAAVGAAMRVVVPRFARSCGHTVRDAARALRRSPAHGLFILVVLAVAIAAATVTFSVVDAVVLKPLPFDRPDQLVQITGRNLRGPYPLRTEQYWPIHDGVPAFEHVAALVRWTDKSPVIIDGTTEQLNIMRSTAELFHVLGLVPVLGRVWSSDEETRGDRHVALISFRFWQRRFSGDPSVLGRVLQVDKDSYQIVGVLPAAADAAQTIGWLEDVWLPSVPDRVVTDRSSTFVAALARLREGATPALAEAQLKSALAPLTAAKPAVYADWQPQVTRWQEAMVARVSGWMLLALGAVALVVIIGCVNAANVMLTRSVERARELAVRASLGASRRQIALSLLCESLLLSLAAAACALLFAVWGVGAAKAALPAGIFRADTISLNGRVLTVSILAAVATGLLFGMVPAWLASRVSIVTLLKDTGATATTVRRGWRSALLVAQIACISVLLVVCTLFVASFIRVMQLDLGIERSTLLAVSTRMPFKTTVDDVAERMKRVPGIVDVAVVTYTSPPVIAPAFGGAYPTTTLHPADAGGEDAPAEVLVYRVTPNYFDVTGMRFSRGSVWSSSPALDPLPAVIDEVAARRLFGARDPLGLQILSDFPDDAIFYKARKAVFTVVGVVPFVYSRGPEGPAQPSMYLPIVQRPTRRFAGLFARTSMPADTLVPAVETALAPIAPEGESYVHAVDEAFRRLTATRRFTAALMSLFALFAMLIGAAGIYGVMASIVAQRTREIGVRIALGATARDISRGVLRQVARHLALGLVVGLPAAWGISRGFGSLFFQVGPTDPSIYATVAVLLAAVALVAAIVPARRASRVDPIVSLRSS